MEDVSRLEVPARLVSCSGTSDQGCRPSARPPRTWRTAAFTAMGGLPSPGRRNRGTAGFRPRGPNMSPALFYWMGIGRRVQAPGRISRASKGRPGSARVPTPGARWRFRSAATPRPLAGQPSSAPTTTRRSSCDSEPSRRRRASCTSTASRPSARRWKFTPTSPARTSARTRSISFSRSTSACCTSRGTASPPPAGRSTR